MKVLVIDDEEIIRDLAERILNRAGFQVYTAGSGQTAIRLFFENQNDIKLVLVDVFMDGLTGIDTVKRIRRASPDLPCIVSSGGYTKQLELPEDLRHNLYFLDKPYRANDLADLAQRILSPAQPQKAS